MQLHDFLIPKRVTSGMPATSKKRVLEQISALLREGESELDQNAAFQSLVERERLGSTGIGNGVALPHGRVKGLKRAVGAFATLAHDMDYEAADGKPVNMVFALLVPENANEEHLHALSIIAAVFSDQNFRNRLLKAGNAREIYRLITHQNDVASRRAS
jgi:PTS system nitrogen regulatory IIA component